MCLQSANTIWVFIHTHVGNWYIFLFCIRWLYQYQFYFSSVVWRKWSNIYEKKKYDKAQRIQISPSKNCSEILQKLQISINYYVLNKLVNKSNGVGFWGVNCIKISGSSLSLMWHIYKAYKVFSKKSQFRTFVF